MARAALAGRRPTASVDLDARATCPRRADESTIAVVGSGNLGLVYFTGNDHRLTLEELEAPHPDLVGDARRAPGRLDAHGPRPLEHARRLVDRAAGRAATSTTGGSRARTRLTPFGPNTLLSLRREDAMEHAPDLLLISQYDPELGEVAAFEELIGSHGGLGGPQTEPFILHPAEWTLDEEVPLGAPAIYRNLRRWLESIDIQLGKPAASAATTTPPAIEVDEAVAVIT